MAAWISLASCQAATAKPANDPNVFQPPPFFGDVPAVRKDKAGASARAGAAGPTGQMPTAAAPAAVALAAALPAQPGLTPPGASSAKPWPAEVLAPRADRAIRAGLDYLYAAQKPDGSWDTKYASQHPGGVEALVILAAIEAG